MPVAPLEVESDRRSSPRIPLFGEATIQVGAERFEGRLVDVGTGGLAVLSPRPPPGGFLRVSFRLGSDSSVMDLDGVVVRSRRCGRDSLWGVQLHGNDPGTRTRLRDYVNTHQAAAQSA